MTAPDTTKAPEGVVRRWLADVVPLGVSSLIAEDHVQELIRALSPLPVLGEGLGSSADADTHRATDGAVVGVSPLEIAYGCLWHATTDEKALHEARAHVRRHISHNGQARGIAWALKSLAATRDDTKVGTEKPSGFGVDNENHEALREAMEALRHLGWKSEESLRQSALAALQSKGGEP